MVVFVVRLADLEFVAQDELSVERSMPEIVEIIRRQFDCLPSELDIEINNGVATIRFEEAPEDERSEARRLFEKAGNRAGMHAGFQQIAPEHETGMDLAEPFLTALELFQEGESDAA